MIRKHPQINHVEETENVKWCVFKVPQYTLSSRLNMDYSCTSKYYLTNQIEKTTTKIIIKILMILDFKILSL